MPSTSALTLLACGASALVLQPVRQVGTATAARRTRRQTALADAAAADSSKEGEEAETLQYKKWVAKYRNEESSFMKVVYQEQAEKYYQQENPDYWKEAMVQQWQGPLTTFAVIAGGFYSLPVISGLFKGISQGGSVTDIISSVAQSVSDPVNSVGD